MKFGERVWSKPWVTKATKWLEFMIGWWCIVEFFIWRLILKDWCGKAINEMYSSLKSMGPKSKGKIGMM